MEWERMKLYYVFNKNNQKPGFDMRITILLPLTFFGLASTRAKDSLNNHDLSDVAIC
jgi:hypothetical protein